MDMKRVFASSIVLAAVFAAPAFAGGDGIGGGSNNCSRVGTWFGVGDSGITWMATDNPGPNATVGQLTLEWSVIDPTLGGFFPDVVRATSAVGVWQKVNRYTYEYTWIAYGLDAGGLPFYVARASGAASMVDRWRDVSVRSSIWPPRPAGVVRHLGLARLSWRRARMCRVHGSTRSSRASRLLNCVLFSLFLDALGLELQVGEREESAERDETVDLDLLLDDHERP